MTRKRITLTLLIVILVSVTFVACSSQIKAFTKDPSLIATRTPFQSIATYTSTPTPLTSVGDALASDLGATLTPDGGDSEGEDQVSAPTLEPSLEEGASDPTETEDSDQDPDSSEPTDKPAPSQTPRPSATLKPTRSVPKTNTPKPPADTNTPKPAGDTNTPVPADTNTSVPPADTNTPAPPADTNTPVPPADTATAIPPTATSPPAGCVYSGNSSYESQVITLINQERAAEGLSALTQNSKLTSAARLHSQDMACNDNWSHTGSDGSTLGQRLLAAGYSYSWAGENIATSSSQYFSPSSVVNMWMNSPGHRANILNPNFVHIGVGFRYADDVTIGDWGVYDAYYTADFAAP